VTINNAGLWLDQSASNVIISADLGGPLPTFRNTGTYRKSNSTTSSIGTFFSNGGTVDIQSGALAFFSGYTQTAGETKLNGGGLSSSTALNIQDGKLSGTGTVTANVSNSGQVNPGASPGILNISGTYTQTSTGTLNIEIGGLTVGTLYDRLAISGTATLSGSLNVSLINNFVPNPVDSFQIISFGSHTGTFSTTSGLDLGGGRSFQVNLTATSLTLVTPP